MSRTFRSSRACVWVEPRQSLHASERYMRFGKVLPMAEQPTGWFPRLRAVLKKGER